MTEAFTRSQVREEVRRFLLEQMTEERSGRAFTQTGNIWYWLTNVRGIPYASVQQAQPLFIDELHRLVIAGVLRPGYGDGYETPWLSFTERGRELLEAEGPPVYDPDGYVEHVRTAVPALPEVAIQYLREAVSSFNLNHHLSSAVMLGVASEAVLVSLIEAYVGYVGGAKAQKLGQSLEREPIFRTYTAFRSGLDVSKLPAPLQKDLDVYLGNIFNFIRMTRNEAGHPTGLDVDPSVIEAQLRAFESYARRLSELSEHFKAAGNA